MNYADITHLSLVYSDRTNDVELSNELPRLVSLVESRINKVILSYNMSTRQNFTLDGVTKEFDLPANIGQSINALKVIDNNTGSTYATLTRVPQVAMDVVEQHGLKEDLYCIENKKIRTLLPYADTFTLRIDFMQSVPSLYTEGTNWLSDSHADCYVFGLTAEIYAYTKNSDGFNVWNARFLDAIEKIELNSDSILWNNMPLVTRVG